MARKSKETWVDSKGVVAYIKGIKREDPRLSFTCFREAKDMKAGSTVTVTLQNGDKFTFYPPFKKIS